MPFPIIVWSLKDNADQIGYELLNRLDHVLRGLTNIVTNTSIEPYHVKKDLFIACGKTGGLDYDFKYENNVIEYGVRFPSAFSKDSMILRIKVDTSVHINIPKTPYYSTHLYVWRKHGIVVLSPWNIPVLLSAALFEGFNINPAYIVGQIIQGYPIENDEIHPSVRKLSLGSNITITPGLNIETKEYTDYDKLLPPDTDKLVSLLLNGGKAFLSWASEKGANKIRIGLSGGLDSRTVSAVLAKANEELRLVDVEAFTTRSPTTDPDEVKIAKEVADILGLKHEIVYHNPSEENLDKMLSGMLGVLQTNSISNNIALANGTGGDKTLAPLGRLRWKEPKTLLEAASLAISRYDYSRYSKDFYSVLESWRKDLIYKLLQFKEKTPLGLFRRYLVGSRMLNWLVAFQHPLITPFLYPPYFDYALMIEPRAKNYYLLYSKVLAKIDRTLLSVPYYNLRCRFSLNPLLQKIKLNICFLLTAARKVVKGQRGSLVPARQAYIPLEKTYHRLGDQLDKYWEFSGFSKNSNIVGVITNEAENIIKLKILDARALVVLYNILKCLSKLLLLLKACEKA